MKKLIISALIVGFSNLFPIQDAKSQSAKIIGENILYGTLTGAALGTATMMLNNKSDYSYFRIGVGLGILGGTGIAVYDITSLPSGQQLYVDGIFNEASNSSMIILLDTVYGAGFGAAVGSAVVVIGNRSIAKGVQYGAGAGAWVGFGFGLIDSFFFADRYRYYSSNNLFSTDSLFTLNRDRLKMNFIQPDMFTYRNLSGSTLSLDTEPAIHIFSLRKVF
jgi:hypothetical protein